MNCNHWNLFLLLLRLQCFSLGDLCRSSRHTGLF
nr:MAG TPA: hypothetical protein [Caudoviricetes sp.]